MASPKPPPTGECDIDNPTSTSECEATWTATSPFQQLLQIVGNPRLPVREPCPICLQPSFPAMRITLPCHHSFCASCLSLWLNTTDRPACPLCRCPYPYKLYPLLTPGFTVALPANMPVSTAIKIAALTTLPPWILLFMPATAFVYSKGIIDSTTEYSLMTTAFHLLVPFLTAWLWICPFVAWHSSDHCPCPNRLRLEKGTSIISLVNRTPWFLYMWDEVVPVPLWMGNGMLMMLSGTVVRVGVVLVRRWTGVWE